MENNTSPSSVRVVLVRGELRLLSDGELIAQVDSVRGFVG